MRNHTLRTRPGRPYPLGATWDGAGVNFALFSDHATGVELCLFDPADPTGEAHRVPVLERTDRVWHVYLPEGRPGLLYGYRVDGPYEPAAGHRFNARKLLLDPYAKAIDGLWEWNEAIFPYLFGNPESSRNDLDSAPYMPKSVVVNPFFDWGQSSRPNVPWHRTVVYETHVKGFTIRNPQIPEELRGTYAGMAHPSVDRRPYRDLEPVCLGQLAHHLPDRRRGHPRSRPGGLSLMGEEIGKLGMRPSHPGEFIREEILNELGLSVTRAAELLGVRRATLSDLLNGRASLTPEMALRVEKAFGGNSRKELSLNEVGMTKKTGATRYSAVRTARSTSAPRHRSLVFIVPLP